MARFNVFFFAGIFWSLVVSVVLRVGGVPTSQIDVDGSVLQTCGEKLSETTQSEVQYDNGTVVAEVETNHCV